ncbi:cysteine dioxygenase family protein [Priestia aryabhattai]|uniref:cysteine dioxygenase n=1 Tax=Priestia aryabhattai TaxID=412384 RepID=UPI002881EF67|nr:cysteine dioxygenase family protein [Priestia aryabhattai]MDT0145651.1 cysteine dioxygenase family protein [Priestia aryabhattai]MDT0151193.1 cysteine dioxygenase family protein [Priestia aryabhattai]MED4002524.1 cysteine dioxygenase family protein [Priestia aryabhattai]
MKLIESIKRAFDNLPSYEEVHLVQAVQNLNLTIGDISEYVVEPKELEYGRNVVYKSKDVEVIVVHLPSMAKTLIHDHGLSSGCILVVEGHVLNVLYQLKGKKSCPIYNQAQGFAKNDFFLVKKDTIHMMYNPSTSPTITFHVYSPPLQGGKVYDPSQ